MKDQGVLYIELEKIDSNPWQTRSAEDPAHVQELAEDILEHGLMQIPLGRMIPLSDRYQLAFGHSRLTAYRKLYAEGHEEFGVFPIHVISELENEQMAIFAFNENEKRKDLNPIERAAAIKKIIDDFGWTQQVVAEQLKVDRSSVANALRMLSLPGGVQDAIADGLLPVRSAMALLPYYELTELERGALEELKPEYGEFLAAARSGQVNSDTIRAEVGKWIELLHPAPEELPLIAETPSTQEILPVAVEGDQQVQESEGTGEEMEEEEGDELGEEKEEEETPSPQPSPGSGEGEKQKASEPAKPTTPAKPAQQPAAPAPAPAPVTSKDMVLTIRWFETGGVSIAVLHPGESQPRFAFKTSLTAADFPELLEGMGIA